MKPNFQSHKFHLTLSKPIIQSILPCKAGKVISCVFAIYAIPYDHCDYIV